MSAHARLAPSSAPQWGNCSGAVHACAGRVDTPVERTVQGTAAHWVMEQCAVNWRSSAVESDLFCSDWVGKVDPDGTVVTAEIAEGAQFILDDLLRMASLYGGYEYLLIEQRVAMPGIHADNWGTLDLALYNPGRKILVLSDLKFGHRLVRAKGNLQMIDYIEGLYETFALPMDTEVHIRIVQPFAYAAWGPVDEHVCLLSDLVPYFMQLKTKAHESDTNPKLSTGKWCRDCAGREDCSAAREHAYLWASICDMPYQMDKMSPDDKARESDLLADALAVIKARKEAIDDTLKAEISSGKPCAAKVYEASEGAIAWHDGSKPAAIAAFKALGVDITKTDALTPRQALQKVPKEKQANAEQMLKSFASRKIKTQLVDTEDSIVSRAFGTNSTNGV